MAETNGTDGTMRLQVFMAHAGVASRRKCEEFIQDGLVKVNGRIVTELGFKVGEDDSVIFRRRRVYPIKNFVYLALNKPPKFLSTTSDPERRPLALDLLRPGFDMRLYPVGRLDFLSSGLIFFTNDGDFALAVSHPRSEVEKEYLVETKKDIPEDLLQDYQKGITVEGERYRLKSYTIKSPHLVLLVLGEGKNREIRSVFASRGLYPKRIHRVRIGSVTLKGLEPGRFRRLSPGEVSAFFKKGKGHGSSN
ncbi:MAG: rRNA pseudouridine synthase [Spirochaetales bacterium]|jgi:23S rRNA pseudouridine2605 synthase|nr:rRNA pseudouridine synthase [Spirochaetales bacterium]